MNPLKRQITNFPVLLAIIIAFLGCIGALVVLGWIALVMLCGWLVTGLLWIVFSGLFVVSVMLSSKKEPTP